MYKVYPYICVFQKKGFVMPKARHKKTTEYQASMTKAVFLFGSPNKGKLELLEQIQAYYADLVNKDIEVLSGRPDLMMELVKKDKKSPNVRALEKAIRPAGINSAFCQNAFDCAFTKLANRLDSIRIDMYAENQTMFTQSKVLYAMSVLGQSQAEMASAMDDLASKVKKKDSIAFYKGQAEAIRKMSEDSFCFAQKEFTDSYLSHCLGFAIPHVDREQVSLDSRLMRLEVSTDTVYPYVINITNPFARGQRTAVPLQCSRNGLRRLKQYKVSGTVHYTVWGKDKIRIQASFEKKLEAPDPHNSIGVDTGMKDCFYCSDGRSIGTMEQVIAYYKDVVEPSFAGLSDLRNKKAKILHYLRKHPALPPEVRKALLEKVDRLEKMIRTADLPYTKKRRYYAWLNEEVSTDVRQYIEAIGRNTLTVLERLDIKEFRKSRRLNGELSVFARGLLQEKLMSELNWHGMAFLEVEPDYSSQTCPVCGHIDAKSRNGKQFCCTLCGHTDDADHNAAVVLRSRASDQEFLDACENHKYDHNARQAAIRAIGKKRSAAWKKDNTKMMKATA